MPRVQSGSEYESVVNSVRVSARGLEVWVKFSGRATGTVGLLLYAENRRMTLAMTVCC